MRLSVDIDNMNKNILILVKGPKRGLHDITLTAYSITFTKNCFSLYHNGTNTFLFINGIKTY